MMVQFVNYYKLPGIPQGVLCSWTPKTLRCSMLFPPPWTPKLRKDMQAVLSSFHHYRNPSQEACSRRIKCGVETLLQDQVGSAESTDRFHHTRSRRSRVSFLCPSYAAETGRRPPQGGHRPGTGDRHEEARVAERTVSKQALAQESKTCYRPFGQHPATQTTTSALLAARSDVL